ncbi:MAG: metal-dependent transcriptional regulator [Lachnospiraceae bacterium]|nr:metal-dependent transcriptional regulator [Lachnospiraceae bacterium]
MVKSSSSEDYLKCILALTRMNGTVRSVDISKEMGVTRPSVSNAMKKLREQNLIYFGGGGNIFLTDEGLAAAEKVYSKHSTLSKLLRIAGVNQDTADKEACMMEHVICDSTYECLDEYIKKHDVEEEVKPAL